MEDLPMTTTTSNGQRKTLADQIDRLDSILTGLSEALNESVAAAVQDAVGLAVREAVRGVLIELVTNPEALDLLRAALLQPSADGTATIAPEPMPPQEIPVQSSLKQRLGRAWGWAQSCLSATVQACAVRLQMVWRFRGTLALALGLGTVAGVASYFVGPWLAAACGWLGGFLTAVGMQARAAWQRLLEATRSPD
jgi:hypothetical protein